MASYKNAVQKEKRPDISGRTKENNGISFMRIYFTGTRLVQIRIMFLETDSTNEKNEEESSERLAIANMLDKKKLAFANQINFTVIP